MSDQSYVTPDLTFIVLDLRAHNHMVKQCHDRDGGTHDRTAYALDNQQNC